MGETPLANEVVRGTVKGFTHVSVGARDLDESVGFYGELFGLEEVPHPDFSSPVRWLRVGGWQLHLFESDGPALPSQPFGIDVGDFEAVYTKASEMGVRVGDGYFANLHELPGGAVQMYVRDPSGNLIEVNWPDSGSLNRSVVQEEIQKVGGGPDVVLYGERSEG